MAPAGLPCGSGRMTAWDWLTPCGLAGGTDAFLVTERQPMACGIGTMTLEEVKTILEAEVVNGENLHKIGVEMGCGADLMSDVLAFTKTGALLLTGLTNAQVVRTSDMADVVAVCFVRGKAPGPETIELAHRLNLPLLMTKLPMFEACGRLYREGLMGCSECNR